MIEKAGVTDWLNRLRFSVAMTIGDRWITIYASNFDVQRIHFQLIDPSDSISDLIWRLGANAFEGGCVLTRHRGSLRYP